MRDARIPEIVIPANAGIQRRLTERPWVPAFAGTTAWHGQAHGRASMTRRSTPLRRGIGSIKYHGVKGDINEAPIRFRSAFML